MHPVTHGIDVGDLQGQSLAQAQAQAVQGAGLSHQKLCFKISRRVALLHPAFLRSALTPMPLKCFFAVFNMHDMAHDGHVLWRMVFADG